MRQLFSRPNLYIARCGHLDCDVVERRVPGAPGFVRGLRALFVCDTHVLRRTTARDIDALVDRIATQRPDILLLGGDYADRSEDASRLFEAMAAIRPPLGSFAVMGNNDAEAWPNVRALRDALAAADIRLLLNESARIPLNGGTLYIGGVKDHKHRRSSARGLYPEAPAPDCWRVLLSHYPCAPDVPPDVMLSGHTHGGQFNLLGLTPFTIGFERILRRDLAALAVAGQSTHGDMRLIVSKGVGASRIQWRVGVRPQIDLIVFD